MSFWVLLVILSLLILIPAFFVFREKNKSGKLYQQRAYQQAISKQKIADEPAKEAVTLHNIPIEKLPSFLQTLFLEMEALCNSLNAKQINQKRWFTVKQLVNKRIPELIHDYLSLDAHYVKTEIVDKETQQTTQDIVYAQLKSIMHFLKRVNQESDNVHVKSILASRKYLELVYDDNGINPDFIQSQNLPTLLELKTEQHSDAFIEHGYSYLGEFYQGEPDALSPTIVYELGRLVFLSDNTMIHVEKMLGKAVRLDAFDDFICYVLPNYINGLDDGMSSNALDKNKRASQRLLRAKQQDVMEVLQQVISLLKAVLVNLVEDSTPDNKANKISQLNQKAKQMYQSS